MKNLLIGLSVAFIVAGCTNLPHAVSTANSESQPAVYGVTASLIDMGIYETEGDVENYSAPQIAAGKVGLHGGSKLLSVTQNIPARKGVNFGFRFKLAAKRNGAMGGFEMFVEHPPMRGVDGKVHTSQRAPLYVEFIDGQTNDDFLYMLEQDFEVLPGEWKLSLLLHGVPVISRSFNLQ